MPRILHIHRSMQLKEVNIMGKRIILTGYGYYLGKKNGMLIIKKGNGEKKAISVGNISCIIVNSRGFSISGDALNLLLKHSIQIIFLSKNKPIGKLQPMMRGGSIKLKKEQLKAQEDEREIFIAWRIVNGKIIRESGKTIIFDREKVISRCKKAGITFLGI